MSHPIPAARRCADSSCNRIDLIPSLPAASAWFSWLALACIATWFTSLPWLACIAIGATVVAAGVHTVRTFVLLKGPRAVRAIEWTESGEFTLCLGISLARLPAELANGSFRLGVRFWVLRFTTPAGARSVLVQEASLDSGAFRRLCRCLDAHLRRGSGRSRQPAVTIRPKV
jgi:hypothetical protein